MSKSWMCYWREDLWRNDINEEGNAIQFCGHGQMRSRSVREHDVLYIVSISGGALMLGGKMTVDRVVSRPEAVRATGISTLYQTRWWALAKDGTPLNLHRRLPYGISSQLAFWTGKTLITHLKYDKGGRRLNGQTVRSMRQLSPKSARCLDDIIDGTDCGRLSMRAGWVPGTAAAKDNRRHA